MKALEVGRPYPERLAIRDGMVVQPTPGGGVKALVHLARFGPGDAEAFAGPVTVHVAEPAPDVPWVALSFGRAGLVLDGPVLVGSRPDLRAGLERGGNGLLLVVTEGPRHVVRRVRLLGLRADVVRALGRALGQRDDVAVLNRAVRDVQRRLPGPDDVVRVATVAQGFGPPS